MESKCVLEPITLPRVNLFPTEPDVISERKNTPALARATQVVPVYENPYGISNL